MRFYLNDSPIRPQSPVSTIEANIESVLGNQYYIGFTAAGGGEWQEVLLRQFYVFNEYASEVNFNKAGTDIVIPDQSEDERVVDYTPPSPPVIAQSERGMTETLMAFTVGGSEDANGVKKYQYRIGGDSLWRDYAEGEAFVLDASKIVATPISLGGDVTVYARALDHGGNISNETEATLRYDIAPGPTLTSPADGSQDLFPENARELVLSFKSRINSAIVGSVTVQDGAGADIAFADGPVVANDARWDPSYGKLTLPFAPGVIDYGKSYTVTVGGFRNTSDVGMDSAEAFVFSTIAREAMPNASIDFAGERLTGLADGTVYKINGAEYAAPGGAAPILPAWFGTEIKIINPATSKAVESAAQTLAIPARRAAPNIGSRPGFITGTTADMEYAANAGAASWTLCAAGETAIANGTYSVRHRATATDFKSAAATVEVAAQTYTLNVDAVTFDAISFGDPQPAARPLAIRSSGNTEATIASVASSNPAFAIIGGGNGVPPGGVNASYAIRPAAGLPVGAHTATVTVAYTGGRTATAEVRLSVREATPGIAIDYEKEQLTGFEPGRLYGVNGVQKTTGTGYIGIENAQLGTSLGIVRVNANTALNSSPQTLVIPARGSAPAAVTAVDAAYADENGALGGLTFSMEYRRAGAVSWADVAEEGTIALAPGAYEVRHKAVAGARFHSAAVSKVIAASRNYKVNVSAALPDGADAGVSGKSETKYIALTFDRAVAGLTTAQVQIQSDSVANVTSVAPEGGVTPNAKWRVGVKVFQNDADAVVSVSNWEDAAGNAYAVDAGTGSGYADCAAVKVFMVVRETLPVLDVNYTNETLTGFSSGTNVAYAINGAVRRTSGDTLPITEFIETAAAAGETFTLSVVKSGGSATVDSEPLILTLPKRPPAPQITFTTPAAAEVGGKISGLSDEMEYLGLSVSVWTPVSEWPPGSGGTRDNLPPGTYRVRKAAVEAPSGAFHSPPVSATFHAFGAVEFGDAYEGYTPVAPRIVSGSSISAAELLGTDASSFVLTPVDGAPGKYAVKPTDNLPARNGEYAATVQFKEDNINSNKYDVSFAVHKKARIVSVTPQVDDTTRLTDSVAIAFENAIKLDYGDVSVQGGAVKAPQYANFKEMIDGNDSSGYKTYVIAVTPSLGAADGAPIRVRINLESDNLKSDYAYQLARPGGAALASHDGAKVSIPRAIESASATPPIAGFSSGVIQFTLSRGTEAEPLYPIDVDAIEEFPSSPSDYSKKIALCHEDGTIIDITKVVRVDADMHRDEATGKLRGYTYRVFFVPKKSGKVRISLPGFGMADPVEVAGEVAKGALSFAEESYFLSEDGRNFLTGKDDAHQTISPINMNPSNDPNTRIYAAPAYTLRLNREVEEWEVEALYVDGKPFAEAASSQDLIPETYFVGYETSKPYIFDGVSQTSIEKRMTIALPAGWTKKNGTHTFHAVLKKTGTEEYSAAMGALSVSGVIPTHKLTVMGGSGGGEYPAGALVRIEGEEPAEGKAFLRWTAGATITSVLRLPSDRVASLEMPMEDVTLTANYADRAAAPSAQIGYIDESLLLPSGAYRLNGGGVSVVTDGRMVIDETWFGTTLEIRRVVAHEGSSPLETSVFIDGMSQKIQIPARPASAPVVSAVAESVRGRNDGRLTVAGGAAAEYGADGYLWTRIAGGVAAGLAPGNYFVRYAATDSAFASASAAIEIAAGAERSSSGNHSAVDLAEVTADGGKVKLDYEKNGGEIVIELPKDKVGEIVDNESGGKASFDLSKIEDAEAVTFLPKSGLSAIAEAGLAVEIVFPRDTVTLNRDAVRSLVTQAGGSEITVELREREAKELTPEQAAALPRGAKAVELSVRSGGKSIHAYSGEIIVAMPYAGRLPVRVWYLADDGEKESVPSEYSAQSKLVTFRPPHLSVYAALYAGPPFIDVNEGDWFFEDVDFVYGAGLMTGMSETVFAPQTAVTRGMLVTVLGRRFGAEVSKYAGASAFADVRADAYFAPYVAWAAEAGIARGVGENAFEPDRAITREELATLLFRCAEFDGAAPRGNWAVRLPFADIADISDWATEPVMWAYMKDLVKGKPDKVFDPQGTATRAETAALLHRFASALEEDGAGGEG
ncbi:MAG: S-layer homology domain-containing protein [Clostridiales Family XIII bacterium]|nr:S-layer homology domain-containing protein [Clostridiales Family XIII bacterium]